jgi:hypothetical protein
LVLGIQEIDCSSMVRAACARGVPLNVLRRSEPELRDLYQANLVLIRPDQHVAWRSDADPDDPGAVIDIVRGVDSRTAPHD